MKKMKYNQPATEVVAVKTERMMDGLLGSGTAPEPAKPDPIP